MFDFEKYTKDGVDKIMLYMNIEDDPIYSKGFVKFIKFIGYKLAPFIMSVATFIILINIFNRIATNYGFEKLVVLLSVILITMLKGISSNIKKLVD